MVKKTDYLAFASRISDSVWQDYEERLQAAGESALRSGQYKHFTYLVYIAAIDAVRFRIGGDPAHGFRAKQALLDIGKHVEPFRRAMALTNREPAGDFPVMDPLFAPCQYIRAYRIVEAANLFTAEERLQAEGYAVTAVNASFDLIEWGPHNRACLQALHLLNAAVAFPNHPDCGRWTAMSQAIVDESWGQWSIEDATTYLPIWLNALFAYEELTGRKGLYESGVPKYYCDSFTRLLNPKGTITDYGDARWGTSWTFLISCLEKGAAVYRCPHMKYTAHRIFETMRQLDDGRSELTLKMASALLDACLWADDDVPEARREALSEEVMDDLIGKKIVFRDGWEETSTYLMLNYRDEGEHAYLAKRHLRRTLPVTAEKTHHGHADENSIVALIADGSVLLHDGGYRDSFTASGEYRADFYHNRVLLRKGRMQEGENFLDYCRDRGTYLPVRTEKIYFYTFDGVEVSRTRVADVARQTEWDRSIIYLKRERCFIVHDAVKALADGEYTLGPVFHSRLVEQTGAHTFETRNDYIGSDEYARQIPNPSSVSLTIRFVDTDMATGSGDLKRCYTMEKAVYQYFSGFMRKEEYVSFTTLLCPNAEPQTAEARKDSVRLLPADCSEAGIGIEYVGKEGTHLIGIKMNLDYGAAQLNVRPTYSFQEGAIRYGQLRTDAAFVHARIRDGNLDYRAVDLTRLDYGKRSLFAVPSSPHLQLDMSWQEGVSAWNRWEGRATIDELEGSS